jgi:hypothetical protein
MPSLVRAVCLMVLVCISATGLAAQSEPQSDAVVAELLALQARLDDDIAEVSTSALTSDACAVRVLSSALHYRRDPGRYRNAMFAELVIDDYAERLEGNCNIIGPDDVASTIGAAASAPEGITDQRIHMVIGYCALKDKNLWVQTQEAGRISLARFLRAAVLSSLLNGTDEDALAIVNAIDAHTASRYPSPKH